MDLYFCAEYYEKWVRIMSKKMELLLSMNNLSIYIDDSKLLLKHRELYKIMSQWEYVHTGSSNLSINFNHRCNPDDKLTDTNYKSNKSNKCNDKMINCDNMINCDKNIITNRQIISDSSFLTINLIIKNPDDLFSRLSKFRMNGRWNWFLISKNSKITMEDIKNNPNMPWCWFGISLNPNLTFHFLFNNNDLIEKIIKNNNKFKFWKKTKYYCPYVEWESISENESITMEDIDNNINFPWCWENISCNPNLTIDFILKYLHKKWDWHAVTTNERITLKMILDNPSIPWVWNKIFDKKNLSINLILNLPVKNITNFRLVGNLFKFDRDNFVVSNCKKILLIKILFRHIKKY